MRSMRRGRDERNERRKRKHGRRPDRTGSPSAPPLLSPREGVSPNTGPPSRELRRLLEGIGTPRPAPFKPDPFQLEALAALEFEDVLVTAPTGSGKTWIAREEIRRLLDSGRRAWYTTPLKAHTNSKYQEFIAELRVERVGTLTGDRDEHWDGALLLGPTNVY